MIIVISLLREGVCVCCCPCAAEWRRRPVVVDDCNGTADCVGRRDEDVSERPALGWFDWQWRRLGYQAPSAHRVMSTTIPPSKDASADGGDTSTTQY